MRHILRVAGAQLGGVQKAEPRAAVVKRMLRLMEQAKDANCALVVFPELALTTFFPRYVIEKDELEQWFERAMPGAETRLLFERAAELKIGFYLGFAEAADDKHYNSSILVNELGDIVGKYRKIHLPGDSEPQPGLAYQHLEKRYFDVGDLGFPVFEAFGTRVGMALCNDRRWPETYRIMALKGAEIILIGYNTPVDSQLYPADERLSLFQNHLSLQSGAHHNALWVVGVAKAGVEDGARLLGGSAVMGPSGEILAQTRSSGDELLVADCDLEAALPYRNDLFDFEKHRQIEHYGLITQRRGVRLDN